MKAEIRERQLPSQVDRLCGVLSTAQMYGDTHYIGWSADGRPLLTGSREQLSARAQFSLDSYFAARQQPRLVDYSQLVPVNYAYGLSAVDFKDQDRGRLVAEDQIRFKVTDAHGQQRLFMTGELALLRAISQSRMPFQEVSPVTAGAVVTDPHLLYTLIIPDQTSERTRQSLVVLFSPLSNDTDNEVLFSKFLKDIIANLIVFDETAIQNGDTSKGYIQAAAKFAQGSGATSGTFGILQGLRKAGIVDFDEEWIEKFDQRKRNVKAKGIRLLNALGVVETDERFIQDMQNPLPHYDIEVDIDTLFDVVDEMVRSAENALE